MPASSDFEELLAVLDLNRVDDDTVRRIPSQQEPDAHVRRPAHGAVVRREQPHADHDDLPPSALSVHFINGGDTAKDIEFHVVRLRDERRFANRRVDAVQDGDAVVVGDDLVHVRRSRPRARRRAARRCRSPTTLPSIGELLRGYEETVPHFVNALQPIEWRYTNDPAWVMREQG